MHPISQSVPDKFQCESFQECQDWYELFRLFDLGNDGFVPVAEFKFSIRNSASHFGLSREEANALLSDVDANGDSFVDFPDFSYTLLSAHIANVIINWSEMQFNWVRASILSTLVTADVVIAVYQRYFSDMPNRVSYVSHIGGFVTGLLLGIVLLRNFRKLEWEKYAWWCALVIFALFVAVCLLIIVFREISSPDPQICRFHKSL